MLVPRTFNPRHVCRSALPGDCLRPAGTMASADSCSLSPTSRLGLPSQTAWQQVSPGKNVDFPCTLAPFTTPALDRIRLRCLWPTRPTAMASYEVRVPQVAGLPPASSRPRLTVTPLPSANGWCDPPSASVGVSHPLANAHAGRTKRPASGQLRWLVSTAR